MLAKRTLPTLFMVCLPLLLLPLAGCKEQPAPSASANPAGVDDGLDDAVLTTFYPTQYFAERISGGLVPVRTALPEGADPIFWQPDQAALSQYQNAKLVITNGAEFEKWVAGAALPRARTVASLSNDALDQAGGPITMESTTHSHGAAGEHTHEGLDGHTWVSPTLAKIQALRIAEAMKEAWPQHAEAFEANLRSVHEDLDMLRVSMADLSPRVAGFRLLASHPAYNYLARDLGWAFINLDLDPESEDTQAIIDAVHDALHEHEDHAHEHEHGEGHDHAHGHSEGGQAEHADDHEHGHGDKPVILLWEGQPTEAIINALRDELGVTSILFSPAEGTPDEGDYMDVMRANLDRLRQAVGG